ncbi:MAG: tyrosine-protein phosphatase [Bdellovibrionota bacterium]
MADKKTSQNPDDNVSSTEIIHFGDLFNFRDLGGLPTNSHELTKEGLIYRTGNMTHLHKETAAYLTEQLGITTYIDFRGEQEIKQFGRPEVLLEAGIEWVNIHIEADDVEFAKLTHPKPEDWVQLYVRLFEKNMVGWAKFLKLIRDTETPVMYGCLFGKDRTGIATGLLLNHLDVQREFIFADYSKTTKGLFPNVSRLKEVWEKTKLTEEEVLEHYLSAHPEIITGFLGHYLDKSYHAFQKLTGGIDELDIKLKEKLLKPELKPTINAKF